MKIKKEDVFFVLSCLLTAAIFAIYRSVNGDFVAYNGDFQNYNIFRRLLDGQVQYRDFTNYLGNGIVFTNYPFIILFRSFRASVFITNFTTSILYCLIIWVTFYTIIKDRRKAYAAASVITVAAFILINAGIQNTFFKKYIYDVLYIAIPGTSMRTTRAFLPFLLVGIFYAVRNRTGLRNVNVLQHIFQSGHALAGIYLLLGVLTVWANDYGYSCVGCFFLIMALVNIFSGKMSIGRRLWIYIQAIVCTALGALLSIGIITHGNIAEYIATNIGITDYQFWYYRNWYGKYLTLADLFSDQEYVVLSVFFFVHAIYFLVKVIQGKVEDDMICRLFIHSTCYGASLIYVIGSGEHNYAHVELISYILAAGLLRMVLIEGTNYLKKIRLRKNWNIMFPYREAVILFWKMAYRNRFYIWLSLMLLLYCAAVNTIRVHVSYRNKEYVEGLQVYSEIGAGLENDALCFSDGELFSTYAGALETVNGIFQPTGTDYIIHVLGDRQRQEYINDFIQGDYRYASTLKNDYTLWEYWSSRVNWYFYRELYMNYTPEKETNYSVIWKKSEDNNRLETDVQLTWKYINESTCRIDVELPDYEEGAYVDLFVKYNTAWTNNRLSQGGIRKVLCVQDGGERYNSYYTNTCYYLREESDGCNIPIYVRNGKGYAYISAYPLSCTRLEGVDIAVCSVVKEPDYPLHVTNYSDNNRHIAENGVSRDGMLLKFDNTEFTTTSLEDAGWVKADGEIGVISNVWKDGNYIYVALENAVLRSKFIYPNRIEVVKKEKAYTAVNFSDNDWICGISRSSGEILISADVNIDKLYAVRTGNVTKKVTKIELTDNGYCLSLEDNEGIQIFAYPQEIRLIYR